MRLSENRKASMSFRPLYCHFDRREKSFKPAFSIPQDFSLTAKLTAYEKGRNKEISKKHYIVEQYFGLSHLHDGAFRARFTTIAKNILNAMCRQLAFNLFRGSKIIPVLT
jgi:hypothetical protein